MFRRYRSVRLSDGGSGSVAAGISRSHSPARAGWAAFRELVLHVVAPARSMAGPALHHAEGDTCCPVVTGRFRVAHSANQRVISAAWICCCDFVTGLEPAAWPVVVENALPANH